MKWPLIMATLVLSVLAYTGLLSAQTFERYRAVDYEDEFASGYRQGYDHGIQDRRAGMESNYEHTDAYQLGTSDFRSGYRQGYSDAYFGRSSHSGIADRGVVEVFSATGFRGNVMSLGIGEYDSIELDDVESLRINGDVRVILFNEPDFEGRSIMLTRDAANLRDLQKSKSFWSFGLKRHHTGSMIIEPLR